MVGTEEYIAPEVLKNEQVCYATDLWSLGVILYEMLSGLTPFKGRNQIETFHNIKQGQAVKFKPDFDKNAQDLVSKLLVSDPSQRIGFHSIEEVKSHDFLKGVNWSALRTLNVPFVPAERTRRIRKINALS